MEIKNTIELKKVLGVEGELEEFVYDSIISTNDFRVTDMTYEELAELLEYGIDVDFYHLVPFSNSATYCEEFIADSMKSIVETLQYYIEENRLEDDILSKIITEPQEVIASIFSCILQDFAIRCESFLGE